MEEDSYSNKATLCYTIRGTKKDLKSISSQCIVKNVEKHERVLSPCPGEGLAQ